MFTIENKMSKKKTRIVDWKLLKFFFHQRLNRWVLSTTTILITLIYLYFICIPDLTIFPKNEDFSFEFYTDSIHGGNSKIINHSLSDSSIVVDYILKEGFSGPYIGLNIWPKRGNELTLARYNRLRLDIRGEKIESIAVALFTLNELKRNTSNTNDLCFSTNPTLMPDRKIYIIDLNQLRMPDWCCAINYISPNEPIKVNLNHVHSLNIGTAYTPQLNTKRSLHIYSISFERNTNELVWLLLLSELLIILTMATIYYLRVRSKHEPVEVTISYKPVEVENESKPLKGFFEYINYINSHFHENELTLEQVSQHCGINQRRIANSIQQAFGCNFKTYVNQIRINESKRLLQESDLNMGEIAFKVGFSSQSHFNRVFKGIVGISPSEFRDNYSS